MRVRADLTAQQLYDALLRQLDFMRATEPVYESADRARQEAINTVEIYLDAFCAEEDLKTYWTRPAA